MKNFPFSLLSLLLLVSLTLTSCDAVEGIFKTGALTGVVGVFLIVLLLWWLVRKMRGGRA